MKKNEQPQHTQGEYQLSHPIKINESYFKVSVTLCKDEMETSILYDVFGFTPEQAEANAQRIVKAVNMHDELIEAIKQISIYAKSYYEWLHHYGGNHMTTQKQSYAGLLEKIKDAKKIIEQAEQK